MKFNIKKWLYPGIGIKRYVVVLAFALVLISAGISILIDFQIISQLETRVIQLLAPLGHISYGIDIILAIIMILAGIITINYSLRGAIKRFYKLESLEFVNRLYEKKVLEKGPRIVAMGGGTGLSNLLRGVKKYTSNITAIVTVADDGGSSGKLRDEFGMLPPGDIRNCLVALADTEPLMQELFQYRFNAEGHLEGHSFGNLFIASLTEILGDFEEAIKESSKVLAIRGKVLPATNDIVHLGAIYTDKSTKIGESVIPDVDKQIEEVFLEPKGCKPTGDAIEAVHEADIIIIGPGSLYTSIIPNLLIEDIVDEIRKSSAVKIYVTNVMTQPGETTGYSVSDHIKAINKHSGGRLFDYVIVNNEESSEDLVQKYKEEGAFRVNVDKKEIRNLGIKVIEGNLLSEKGYIRHDPDELARIIFDIVGSR